MMACRRTGIRNECGTCEFDAPCAPPTGTFAEAFGLRVDDRPSTSPHTTSDRGELQRLLGFLSGLLGDVFFSITGTWRGSTMYQALLWGSCLVVG